MIIVTYNNLLFTMREEGVVLPNLGKEKTTIAQFFDIHSFSDHL